MSPGDAGKFLHMRSNSKRLCARSRLSRKYEGSSSMLRPGHMLAEYCGSYIGLRGKPPLDVLNLLEHLFKKNKTTYVAFFILKIFLF